MNKKYFNTIIALIILIPFALSTTGILLYDHTCFTCKKQEYSLFAINHHNHKAYNDNIVEDHCCQQNECSDDINDTNDIITEENCCSNTVILIRISNPFTIISHDFNKIFVNLFVEIFQETVFIPTTYSFTYNTLKQPNNTSFDHIKNCVFLL